MSVGSECCVVCVRVHFNGLINFKEESYGYLSVVSVVCCQLESIATG